MIDVIISCGVYLFRDDNKLLVGHPTGFKENIWTIPKGRMDEDDVDYLSCAVRELKEETNISIYELDIIKLHELDLRRYRETNKYLKAFFIKTSSDFKLIDIKCDSMVFRNGKASFPEFDMFKWIDLEESYDLLHEYQFPNLDICKELLLDSGKYIKDFKDFK